MYKNIDIYSDSLGLLIVFSLYAIGIFVVVFCILFVFSKSFRAEFLIEFHSNKIKGDKDVLR